MANASFYVTSKRHNSTMQPSGSGTVIDVQLKNGSDIIAPVFLLSLSSIPDFSMMIFEGRTYFITGISSVRDNLWEISAEVDVLATYKTEILSSTQHILYASISNAEIVDNRLPAKTSATYAVNYATLSSALMTGQWKIAVSVVGDNSTTTFLLTPAQVRLLVNSTDMDAWFNQLWRSIQDDIDDITADQADSAQDAADINAQVSSITDNNRGFGLVTKSIVLAAQSGGQLIANTLKASVMALAKVFRKIIATPNAMDCIKAAVFIPWDVVGDGSAQNIVLGEYDTGISALSVYNPIQTGTASIAIPWQATDWRRNSPYHHLYLYLPFMGEVEISPSDIMDSASLNVYYALNVMTGALNYRVVTDRGANIGVYSCMCGVSYPIGASNINPVNVGMGMGAAAGAILGSPTLATAAMAAASLTAIKPTASCVGGGSGGGASGLDRRIILHSVFHDTVYPPSNLNSTIGEPFDGSSVLSAFSGFVQTHNASVSGSMTDTEKTKINNLLNGGIFIE